MCSVEWAGGAGGPVAEARDPAAEEPGGGARVSPEEEGVHQVPREPGGRAGEPEQGAHRGAQVAQGALLYDQDGIDGRPRGRSCNGGATQRSSSSNKGSGRLSTGNCVRFLAQVA